MTDRSHAALMDRTYRYQRWVYDATRAYYLLGRDHLIANLAPAPQARVLEIACGTGRNLHHIARRYPQTALYGLDISQQMLRSARAKLSGRAIFAQADACDFDPGAAFGVAQFDSIIFSYSLSMIPDWQGALDHALALLAPKGRLHLVDFGQQHSLPPLARRALNSWLAQFHVTPRHSLPVVLQDLAIRHDLHLQMRDLHRSYAQYAVLTRA
jgi:S-adenosylmethionine-diacylgycerolhomoserine-N-methlytransferase